VFQPDWSQASSVYKSEALPPAQGFILCETAEDDNGLWVPYEEEEEEKKKKKKKG
jgi:hypothetical protein